jgi:hypothetical protein
MGAHAGTLTAPAAGRRYPPGMDRAQLVQEHPMLFHMAEDGTWPAIQAHGLLSTQALVDLYDPEPTVRASILDRVRTKSIVLDHPEYGRAVVRDQGPLKFLDRCLTPGTTPQEYLDALNSRVFFWLTRERLLRLLTASRYRKQPQTVLFLDTAELLRRHGDRVQLAPFNTGSMHVPTAPPRGAEVFVDVNHYPHAEWRARRGPRADAVVELTIPHAVNDAADLALRVERWSGGIPVDVLHKR